MRFYDMLPKSYLSVTAVAAANRPASSADKRELIVWTRKENWACVCVFSCKRVSAECTLNINIFIWAALPYISWKWLLLLLRRSIPPALLSLCIYGDDITACGWLKSHSNLERIKIANMKSTGTTEMITLRYDGNLTRKYTECAAQQTNQYPIVQHIYANTRKVDTNLYIEHPAREDVRPVPNNLFWKVDLEGTSSFHSLRSNSKSKMGRKKWNERTSNHADDVFDDDDDDSIAEDGYNNNNDVDQERERERFSKRFPMWIFASEWQISIRRRNTLTNTRTHADIGRRSTGTDIHR